MLYDITPPVTPALAVWPGDTPASREVLCDMARGDNLTLSTLHATVHLGAHVDAPNHYGLDAPSIEQRGLDHYLGECQVIGVSVAKKTRVSREDINVDVRAPRVLFHTGTYADPNHFDEGFAALDPGLVEWLAGRGAKLIGIDTPSVDLFESKELPAHKTFLKHDVAILEGIVLDGVPDGLYELIALPLKLVGFDASPVRAVLRSIDT